MDDFESGSAAFSVAAANTPPSGTDNTITIYEDAMYVIRPGDFGFVDADGDNFISVQIATLPDNGTLYYNIGFGPQAVVLMHDLAIPYLIDAGYVYFVPGANANGAGYASFTFQVADDGVGDLSDIFDQTPNTITFNVIPVNDAPTAISLSGDAAAWLEGVGPVLLDVGSNATVGDIDSLDFDTGTLTVHIGAGLVAGQDQLVISAVGGVTATATTVSVGGVEIATYSGGGVGGGDLVFTFDADATPAAVQSLMRAIAFANTGGDNPAAGVRTIEWTLNDGDGTLNGGSSTGTFTCSVTVTGINDAPSGTSDTIPIDEDETYVFSASDFGFSDVDDNGLMAVQVTTLPGAGTLYYDADGAGGVDPITFSAGTAFTVAMLDAGYLFYVPEADANGSGHASFGFQVIDDGGVANGGVPFDLSLNTITFDVAAVFDAPTHSGLPTALSTDEDTSVALAGDVILDPAPSWIHAPDSASVTTTLSAISGVFAVAGSGAAVVTGNGTNAVTITGSVADVNLALYHASYAPPADAYGSRTITVTTSDGSGSDTDTIDVTIAPVRDTPEGGDATHTTSEDTAYTFNAADFGFSDVDGDSLSYVILSSSPLHGRIVDLGGYQVWEDTDGDSVADTLVTVAEHELTAGDTLDPALMAMGYIVYLPAANANGTVADSFTYQVVDNGGTPPGSAGTVDPTPNTFTFDITAEDDAASVSLAASYTAVEQVQLDLKGTIHVADIDSTAGAVTVTLAVLEGVLTVDPGTSGVTVAQDPLVLNQVTLTGTVAQIEDLLNGDATSTVTYSIDSDTPTATDSLTVTIDDGGQTSIDTATIAITPVNDAPEIRLDYYEAPVASWTEGDGPVLLARGAVFDDDNDAFDGAVLTVSLGGATSGDQLTVHGTGTGLGELSISGSDVLYEGDVVGTWSGGDDGSPLTITFNEEACHCAVELAMASIQYENTHDITAAGTRTVEVTLVDGGGTALHGEDTGTGTFDLAVLPFAHVVTGSAATGDEDAVIALTGVVIDGLTADPATDTIVVRLQVEHGTLQLRTDVAGGLAAGDIAGLGTDRLVLTGTQAAINATLGAAGGLTYQGNAEFSGTDALAIDAHLNLPSEPFSFTSAGAIPAGSDLFGLAMHDLDGDGFDEIVIGFSGNLAVLGTGGLGVMPVGGGVPLDFAFADFDGDGITDIAFSLQTSFGGGSVNYLALYSSVAGTIDLIGPVGSAMGLTSGDFNGDGLTDLATTDGMNGRVAIVLQDPLGGFVDPIYTASAGDNAWSIATGDFNGDNVLDVLVGNYGTIPWDPPGSIDLLLGNGDGTFAAADRVFAADSAEVTQVITADFDGDGVLDIAFTCGSVGVMLGNGDGTFGEVVSYATGSFSNRLVAADFNGDGALDIAVTDFYTLGYFSVLGGNGDGSFENPVQFATDDYPYSIAAGDPDGDGDIDLVVGTLGPSASSILDMLINGTDAVFHEITGSKDITVDLVDDEAVAVDDPSISVDEDSVVAIDVLANDSDIDGPAPVIATVEGQAFVAGQSVTLASGAIVTLEADGRLSYDPNGQFHPLVSPATAAATGASNDTATDSFSYTLAGGASATVTVTVVGVDGRGDQLLGTPGVDGMTGTGGNDVIRAFGDVDAVAGGAGDDTIYGNGDGDTLSGNAGADRLYGGLGDDVLEGGDGDDVLVGNLGDDTMRGGVGDDTYYVGQLGDLVVENLNEGSDTVRTQIDYTLTANVETLVLSAGARAGTGNALGNTLFGSGGADTLAGLAGDDVLRGRDGRDVLNGGDGADLIDGGVGKDTLTGGADRDVFQFRDGQMGATRSLADMIIDFSQADHEKIQLNLVDADVNTAGNQAFAFLGTGAFTGTAGELRYEVAGGNTWVAADTNGDGTADWHIGLTGVHALVAIDFVL